MFTQRLYGLECENVSLSPLYLCSTPDSAGLSLSGIEQPSNKIIFVFFILDSSSFRQVDIHLGMPCFA